MYINYVQKGERVMINNEFLQDELCSVNDELDKIVDQMIGKYGKFITCSNVDSADRYQVDLVRSYDALIQQKDYLVAELFVNQR